jgi:D-glycero-beta-D-manno-heptose-7-phosphate kinase
MNIDRTPLQERLVELVRRFPKRKVLVIGDVVADEFVYGEIARVSREAPVMILRYETTETVPGGAGNAASNVAALGGSAALVGLLGRDRPGRATKLELRNRGVDTKGLVSVGERSTPTKTRILAGLAHSIRQQVIRVDNDPAPLDADALSDRLLGHVCEGAAWADVVVISDYNYGTASPAVVEALREAVEGRRVPVLVDSRFRLTKFAGFASATPNEVELEAIAAVPLVTDAGVVEAARRVAEELGYEALLVTRGSRGMVLVERKREPIAMPVVGSAEAIDVTGAGDTVIATYALGLAAGASYEEAAHLANHAGGIAVMKRGTATVSREELLASVLRWLPQQSDQASADD